MAETCVKDNPENEATPGNLLPIMVKAIQELNKQKDEELHRYGRKRI